MATSIHPIVEVLLEIQDCIKQVENIYSNPFALSRAGHLARDLYARTAPIADALANPKYLSSELLAYMEEDGNIEWMAETFKYMTPDQRVNVYLNIFSVLSSKVEALYEKWHRYNNLGYDDSLNLPKLERLLNRLAACCGLALPERPKVINKTTRNYTPIEWGLFLEKVPQAVK